MARALQNLVFHYIDKRFTYLITKIPTWQGNCDCCAEGPWFVLRPRQVKFLFRDRYCFSGLMPSKHGDYENNAPILQGTYRTLGFTLYFRAVLTQRIECSFFMTETPSIYITSWKHTYSGQHTFPYTHVQSLNPVRGVHRRHVNPHVKIGFRDEGEGCIHYRQAVFGIKNVELKKICR